MENPEAMTGKAQEEQKAELQELMDREPGGI